LGLLAPWFLGGLLAIGLPVYLHLLRRHKSTPQPFASLMFFERRTQSSIQHRRLQHYLLLALRAALLLLLMFAFAKPYFNSASKLAHSGDRIVALCIDDSFSMRQGGRLGRAKHDAAQIVDGLRSGDHAQVIAIGGAGSRMLTTLTHDNSTLRAAIDGVEAGDGASVYAEVSRALNAMAKSANKPIEGHLFSDLQKSSLPAAFSDLRLNDGITLVTHAAAGNSIPNFTVESVQAPRRIFDPKRVRIVAAVAGHGTTASQQRVQLVVNQHVVAEKTVDVPADGRAIAEFTGLDAPYGMTRAEVRIPGGDAFPDDDHFNFPVERDDPRPALFVHDTGGGRSLLYFQNALEASGVSPFRLEALSLDQAPSRDLARYAFVVLSDTGRVPAGFEANLEKYVQGGGAVLAVLGSHSTPGSQVPVVNLNISNSRYAAPERDRFLTATVDAGHPAIGPEVAWSNVRVYQAVQVQPGNARIVAKLSDGTPLLLDQRVGEGRVMVMTSPLDNTANDLPIQPAFVAFVQRATQYLGGLSNDSPSYTVGASLDLRASKASAAPAEVVGPDGKRAISLSDTTRAQSLQLTRAGFYDVRRANGKHELVAVNPDRRESDFAIVPSESLALWKATGPGNRNTAPGEAPEQTKISLWWYVMALASLLALAESWLGNQYLAARPVVVKSQENARRNVA
jgi:hypothetical protein